MNVEDTYGCVQEHAPAEIAHDDEGRPYVAGRLLVGYASPPPREPGATRLRSLQDDMRTVRSTFGLVAARSLAPGSELVTTSGDARATASLLRSDSRIEYAHLDYLVRTAREPNDDAYTEQWALHDFGAGRAWDVRTSADGRVVAIIDSGFDTDHVDLAARFLPGWDFCEGDADVTGRAPHGTHVAGIVGAVGDNGLGVAGLAWDGIGLLPVKIFDDPGVYAATSDAVAAIRWAAGLDVPAGRGPVAPANRHPADVINLSFGASLPATAQRALDDAVCDAHRAGVLVVAAAGNYRFGDEDRDVLSPANGACAIAVGSVGEDGGLSDFSRYGPTEGVLDLVAPGERILSTIPGDRFGFLHGTSMASPYVAGTAALLLAEHGDLSPAELEHLLKATAWLPEDAGTGLADVAPAEAYGLGITCVDAAVGAASWAARCGR